MSKTIKKENYNFKHIFTNDEIAEKSRQLARICEEKTALEDEKRFVIAEFKAKIDGKIAEINLLSNNINTGFEYVTKTCIVEHDYSNCIKTYFHEGVKVGTEKLKPSEFQTEIDAD